MSTPRNLLIVTYTFPPFGTVGHVVRLTKFARYLPEFGWRPTVLTIADSPRLRFFERNSSFLLDELSSDVKVVRTAAWQPNPAWAKTRRESSRGTGVRTSGWRLHRTVIRAIRRQVLVPDLAVTWIPTVVRAAKRLAEVEKFDAVLASIPLNSNGVAGAIIARRLGVPLVLDVRDDWVDGAYFLEKGAMARAAERRLERFVFESAKAIVLVSKLSLQRHQSQHPSLSERFTFIPNGFDLSDLGDRSREERREVSGRLLLVHAGMTGSLRSPVPLFRAIRAILDTASAIDKPRFALVMVGELLPEYRRAIVDLGLEGVVDVRQYLPTSDYLRLMSEADVLVAIADAAYVTEIPGKLYTHWAVGRPTLLLADPGAGTELMSEHKLGWSCSPSDHEGIKELLLGLWRQKRAEGIGSVQPGGIDRFDRRNLTAELSFLLNSVAPSHN